MKDGLKILVIEDDVPFAQTLEAILVRLYPGGTSVLKATSLEEAAKHLSDKTIDMILLDLTLPDSKGLNTLNSVHAQTKAPIVVFTGHDDEQLASDTLQHGAQNYLLKGDINKRQLARAINYAIERQKCLSLNAEKIRLFEQREDFMAALTHDLKNPLIGANRILELMIEGTLGSLPEQHVRLLANLKDGNESLIAMVRNLLEVYRFEKDIEKLQKERTDLHGLVCSYIDTARPRLQDKDITITVHCQNVGAVPTEQNAMLRVIQNLIENAIKFTPNGGQIAVKLWNENSNVFCQIADSGPGVPEEDRHKLFQRFFQGRRGKSSASGTGLGLYLCRQIVEAHEGQIWCEQYQENSGAVFTMTLPFDESISA